MPSVAKHGAGNGGRQVCEAQASLGSRRWTQEKGLYGRLVLHPLLLLTSAASLSCSVGCPTSFRRLLCGGLTNPVPTGATRSSCPCVTGLKVKEVCAIVVHSCLSGSSWLAAIGKLPFLPHDADKCPEGPQQARFLITR